MVIKNITYSIILLCILVLATWTTFFFYAPEFHASKDLSLVPDGFMENVNALFIDEEGNPHLKIITPKLVHYLKDDRSELEKPRISVYHGSTNPWIITANSGTALHGTKNINFKHNVEINHLEDEENPNTRIKTMTLSIFPSAKTAQTDDLITLTQPNMTIRGKGMFADLATGFINLKSQTRGEYVPN